MKIIKMTSDQETKNKTGDDHIGFIACKSDIIHYSTVIRIKTVKMMKRILYPEWKS